MLPIAFECMQEWNMARLKCALTLPTCKLI